MTKILIGTSGYSYQDWIGPVYPPGTPAKDFLKLYAKEFLLAELNFSYYRQPDARTTERMIHLTPMNFLFAIKAHKSMTHEVTDSISSDIKEFKAGIAPLHHAAKLGAVLLQFPYSFHYTPGSRKHLDMLCGQFESIPLAVEFRNSEWQRESVYEGMRKRNVALVSVDEPDLPKLLKPSEVVTAGHSYIRFHGRNKENWWSGDNVSRYDYLYNDDELMEWIPRIQKAAAGTNVVMISFNNHFRGQAVKNARRLKELLAAAGIKVFG